MAQLDEVIATFWARANPTGYGIQPPLTEKMIREAERVLEVSLPSTLLDLLRVQNGGIVADEWNAFPTSRPTSWSADHVPFDELMGIGRDDRMTSLLETPYLVNEWGMPSPLVLLSGDGHYWIALDYRVCGRMGDPSVTWFDTELGTELALARDFRAFLEGLLPITTFEDDLDGPESDG